MKIASLLFAALTTTVPLFASEAPKASSACAECCGQAQCAGLISTYEKVSTALAADDLAGAQAAAEFLECCLTCDEQEEVAAQVASFRTAASLAEARKTFKGISAAVIPLAAKLGDHFVMNCPMAGADWIQTSATLANPYYGSQMLRCGMIKQTVKLQGEG